MLTLALAQRMGDCRSSNRQRYAMRVCPHRCSMHTAASYSEASYRPDIIPPGPVDDGIPVDLRYNMSCRGFLHREQEFPIHQYIVGQTSNTGDGQQGLQLTN